MQLLTDFGSCLEADNLERFVMGVSTMGSKGPKHHFGSSLRSLSLANFDQRPPLPCRKTQSSGIRHRSPKGLSSTHVVQTDTAVCQYVYSIKNLDNNPSVRSRMWLCNKNGILFNGGSWLKCYLGFFRLIWYQSRIHTNHYAARKVGPTVWMRRSVCGEATHVKLCSSDTVWKENGKMLQA